MSGCHSSTGICCATISPGAGRTNYTSTLLNIDFQSAAANTAIYLAVLVPAQIVFPLALAFLMLRVRSALVARLYRARFLHSHDCVVFDRGPLSGCGWFNPIVGLLNALGELAGVTPQRWLNDPSLSLWCVAAVAFWKGFCLNLLLYAAALVNIPRELIEAAELEGAGRGTGRCT